MSITNLTADAETFTCNAYLATGKVTTLVDAGSMPGIVDSLRAQSDRVDRVVLTHQHGDHVECLEAVVEAFDPEVFAFDDHPLRTYAIDDGDQIQIGDEDYEVVFTPGHASDHISLVSDQRLISGDIVVYDDAAFSDGSFGRTDIPGASRETLIKSIRRLRDRLPPTVQELYSGHGSVFTGDVGAVIDRALERAERRQPKYPEE